MAEVRPTPKDQNLGTVQEAQNAKLAELAFDINQKESPGKKLSREARTAQSPSQIEAVLQRQAFKPPDLALLSNVVKRNFSESTPPSTDFFPGQQKENKAARIEAPKSLQEQVGATVNLAHGYLEKGYMGISEAEQRVIRAEALLALERLWPEAVTLIAENVKNDPDVEDRAREAGFKAAEMMGLALPHTATMREEVRRAISADKDRVSDEIINDPAFMEEVHKALTEFNAQGNAENTSELDDKLLDAESEIATLDREKEYKEKTYSNDIEFHKSELGEVERHLERLNANKVPDPQEIAAKRVQLGELRVQQEIAHRKWQEAQQRLTALSGNSPAGVVVSSTREARSFAPEVDHLRATYESFVGRIQNLDADIDTLSKNNVEDQKREFEKQKRGLVRKIAEFENKRNNELEELKHKREVAVRKRDALKTQQGEKKEEVGINEQVRATEMRTIFQRAAESAIRKRIEKATDRMQKDAAKVVGETFKRELETRWTTTNEKGKVVLDAEKINSDFSDLVNGGPRFVVTKILMQRGMSQEAAEEYLDKNPDWAKKAEEDLALRLVSKGLQRQTGWMGREKQATIVDLPAGVIQRIQDSEWGDGILMKAFEWNMQKNEELQQLKQAGIAELSNWENFNKWRKRLQKPTFIILMMLLMGGASVGWGTLLSASGTAVSEGPGFLSR